MAKCPHCNKILSDEWVKKEGASLMGKSAKGKSKRRKNAQEAARLRWDSEKAPPVTVTAVVNQPKKKKKPKRK
jgi:hypothetical protein